MKIPITKPWFDQAEKNNINKVLDSGWVVQGPFVLEFEQKFSKYTGTEYAVATSNCTTALHLALIALGIGAGDEVVVPAFTWISSANVVEYVGAKPVFCDIDLKTFNIDLNWLKKILQSDKQKKIKAVMPVNLFGLCAPLIEINILAREYGFKVIEDSACGLGSKIGSRHSGTFGDAGCFSFHPRKAITTGEGGMLITHENNLALLIRKLRDHGAQITDHTRHQQQGSLLPNFDILGYNYRMTDLQAAIGVAQMDKLDQVMEKRIQLSKNYDEALKEIPELIPPYVPENYIHAYQAYVCLFTGGDKIDVSNSKKLNALNDFRNKLMNELEMHGVSVRQGTHAVPSLGYYKKKYNLDETNFPNSIIAERLSLALPLYTSMTDKEQSFVIETVKECLKLENLLG